jgi:hypothetical protein
VADKCKNQKNALDRAKRASERGFDRLLDKEREAMRHSAEAARELGSIGNCIDIQGQLQTDCLADKLARAHYAVDQAVMAWRERDRYLDEWLDAVVEEKEREDKYCDCMNRKMTG